MPRYMIEVDHDGETKACARTVEVLQAMGSHYLTNADWGCLDGVHTAWIVVEAGTKDEARSVLPPVFRAQARITALNGFGKKEEVDEMVRRHGPPRA